MKTHKLYWADGRQTAFTAQLVEVVRQEGRTAFVLDQTAFYPTGGGQPCDLGEIDGRAVVDVEIDDAERILHWIEGAPPEPAGTVVAGTIDWRRRQEMTQQHTGQHLLSQAFFQLFGAETRGFRITPHSTEIDLALEGPPEELPHKIQQAEDLANQIVFEDRPVRTFEVTPEVAATLPLRKESFLPDCVRLVEIADFDLSPCGGTHATRTGEVGLITVRTFERAKKMTRLHVLCGIRALADHRRLRQTLDTAARRLSVGPDELPEAIGRLQAESQLLQRRLRSLTQVVADAEAATLLDALPETPGQARVVARVFDGGEGGKDLDSLTLLAHRLVARPGVLALLATVDGETYRLVLARSSDLDCDVQQMMRQLCTTYGGRGGGTPSLAQGGLPAAQLSAETLTATLASMG
jgi:alanyl-tRNA synthetase